MFDIGFWELIIIFGLGLIILGPERLPKVAIQLGNWAGQARRMARTLTTQIRDELDVDLNQPYQPTQRRDPAAYSRPGVDDLDPDKTDDTVPVEDEDSAAVDPEPAGEKTPEIEK
jgi:sec-independent protein translocase protein TatB